MKESISLMKDQRSTEKIERLISDIDHVIVGCEEYTLLYNEDLRKVHKRNRKSALNLLHYAAMRTRDLSRVQKRLQNLGLSRLAKAESHVMPSLLTTREILTSLSGKEVMFKPPADSIKRSRRILKQNVRELLGRKPKGRNSRIMVTMPSTAATDKVIVDRMIAAGMNVARVNCAHDSPEVWKKIIDNIHAAAERYGTTCKIAMDLAGPKIRTGSIIPGPRIKKIRPRKNIRGQIIEPARVYLGVENDVGASKYISLAKNVKLRMGKLLHFRDARGKTRKMKVVEKTENGYWVLVYKVTYVETGMYLFNEKQLIHPLCQVGNLPAVEGFIFLRPGNHLRIVGEQVIADHRPMNYAGSDPASISCTNSDVISQARKGEPVVLDDGKFRGAIVAKDEASITVKLDTVRGGGAKLRAEKGINFPKSKLKVRGLTTKDKEDLQFVAEHADIVSMSFVNTPQDVKDLFAAIDKVKSKSSLGIILKIETLRAFKNLIPILLTAMRRHPVGVMIARGDLALEVGWKRIAVVQREIMKICHAAHVPDIWATQVFETLAKSGVPSRAEMTDVWVAQRSECVMLNKGPYIIEAIELLSEILMRMDIYHDKDSAMLPSLKKGSR